MKKGWYLMLIFFLLLAFITQASAFKVEITKGNLPDKLKEGEIVNFTLTFSDYPKGYILSIDTDLVKRPNNPLFTIINNKSRGIDEKHFEVNTSEINKLKLRITGEVPNIKEVKKYDNIVITKYKKTTGYAYYRIKLIDTQGNILDADTKTFDIIVLEREDFKAKLNKISDIWLRDFLKELHDEKGLINEANALADYLIQKQEGISLYWFIGSVLLIAFISFVIGVKIGGRESE